MAINSMLVPVGINERDEKLLEYVCGLTVQGVRRVLVATVVDMSGVEAPVIVKEVERVRERLIGMCAPLMDCDLDVEVRVVTGEIYSSLVALAHERRIDVICCGTEGKSFVDYLFSGSVSEDLFAKSDTRTMTVRYDLLESGPEPAALAREFARRLVVPTDFSASALRALLSAFERDKQALGTVHLVHVVPGPESYREAAPSHAEWREIMRAEAEAKFRNLKDLAYDHDVDAVTVLLDGDPGEAVVEYAKQIDATGIVTGRHGRSAFGSNLLGAVSMHLLREAPCPVVIQP